MTFFGNSFFGGNFGGISPSSPNIYSVQNVIELSEISPLPSDKTSVYVEDERAFYHFDAESTDSPTSSQPTPGDEIVLPAALSISDPGRWIKATAQSVLDNLIPTSGLNPGDMIIWDGTKFVPSPNTVNGVLTVGPPGTAEFTSIKEATDHSVSLSPAEGSEVVIWVAPGTYYEQPFTLPSYVHITAMMPLPSSVTVIAQTPSENLCTLSPNSSIAGLGFTGVTAVDKACIYYSGGAGASGLVDCSVWGCENGILVESSDPLSFAQLVILRQLVNITGPSQGLKYAIRAKGPYARIDSNGLLSSVPAQLLPFYTENPIQELIRVEDNSRIFMAAATINFSSLDNTASAIACYSGAKIFATAVRIENAQTAVRCSGSSSVVTLTGATFENCTTSVSIDTAGASVNTTGIREGGSVYVAPGGVYNAVEYNVLNDELDIYGAVRYVSENNNSLDFTGAVSRLLSSGAFLDNGAVLTKSGPLTVDVSSGSGVIKLSDSETKSISWSSTTLTVPQGSTTYIYVNASGAVTQSTSVPSYTDNIVLGSVVTNSSEIIYIHNDYITSSSINKLLHDYLETVHKIVHKSGLVASIGQSSSTFSVTAGSYWVSTRLFALPEKLDADSFYYVYGDNPDNVSVSTSIDSDYFDNGGSLSPLTAGYYKADLLVGTSDGNYTVIYGDAEYATQGEAESANLPNIPNFVDTTAITIARLVIQQGSGIVSILDERPKIGAQSSSVSMAISHSDLLNLTSDDHPQYLLTSGARPLAGDWSLGNHNLLDAGTINGVQIESHAARHLPGGADGLPVGMPSSIGTTNQEGTATSFARSDHVHAHGDLGGGSLHAPATPTTAGFMSSADKAKLDTIEENAKDDQDATEVPYSPTVPGDWNTSPYQVGAALDEVSSRISLVENPQYFDAYDTTGGQVFTGSITITLDSIRDNSGDFTLDTNNGWITIQNGGKFLVIYAVTLTGTSSARTSARVFLDTSSDGGTTFSEITASNSATYNRNVANGYDSASSSHILTFSPGDILRLRAQIINGGALETVGDATKLVMVEIK